MRNHEEKLQRAEQAAARRMAHAVAQASLAARVPDMLVDIRVVGLIVGYKTSTIYREVSEGKFPKPLHLSARCTRWRAGDVLDHVKAQHADANRVDAANIAHESAKKASYAARTKRPKIHAAQGAA
jgi:prophage regulatory protein